MPVRIVTDSTCDLPAETISRYGIYVLPLYINVGEQGFLDGIDITRDEFYKRCRRFQSTRQQLSPRRKNFAPYMIRSLKKALRRFYQFTLPSR